MHQLLRPCQTAGNVARYATFGWFIEDFHDVASWLTVVLRGRHIQAKYLVQVCAIWETTTCVGHVIWRCHVAWGVKRVARRKTCHVAPLSFMGRPHLRPRPGAGKLPIGVAFVIPVGRRRQLVTARTVTN